MKAMHSTQVISQLWHHHTVQRPLDPCFSKCLSIYTAVYVTEWDKDNVCVHSYLMAVLNENYCCLKIRHYKFTLIMLFPTSCSSYHLLPIILHLDVDLLAWLWNWMNMHQNHFHQLHKSQLSTTNISTGMRLYTSAHERWFEYDFIHN